METPDSELPSWYRPKGLKTKFDFPKAKPGKADRYEIEIKDRRPGKPKRLDKFLTSRFRGYSRSFLQKLIKVFPYPRVNLIKRIRAPNDALYQLAIDLLFT